MGSALVIDVDSGNRLVQAPCHDDATAVLFKGTPLNANHRALTVVFGRHRKREHIAWLHADERLLPFATEVHCSVGNRYVDGLSHRSIVNRYTACVNRIGERRAAVNQRLAGA